MELRDRLMRTFQALPLAHQIGMGAAVIGLIMASVLFFRWVSAPSYTVLASGLDDASMAEVVDMLESQGVDYQIGSGGSTVLVSRDALYTTRAALAQGGVATQASPPGYELLSDQGLSVSDFRQRVDFQRALEGELSRTLQAMDGISGATVHLVIPEEQLFTERQQPATASVLLKTRRTLTASEVEAVTFLVSSSVEGLEAGGITVADASGTVLHAPGDAGVGGAAASRQLRQTREYEQALAADIGAMLARASGTPASVVVRAQMNFDETQTETETFDPESQVAVKERVLDEQFDGDGNVPTGIVGVDGGPLPTDGSEGASSYSRSEATTEYGVDRSVIRTTQAPGKLEKLSVAIVMDDGSVTGATVLPTDEVEALVSAAVGLDAARGDTIAVSTVAFPVDESGGEAGEAVGAMLDRVPQLVALIVLLVVAIGLFLMTRRRGDAEPLPAIAAPVAASMPVIEVDATAPAAAVTTTARPERPRRELPQPPDDSLKRDVEALVDKQPEEIATLLRGWLADQRPAS